MANGVSRVKLLPDTLGKLRYLCVGYVSDIYTHRGEGGILWTFSEPLLGLLLVLLVLCVLLLVLRFLRQHRKKAQRPIQATVRGIFIETSLVGGGWVVTASWQDPTTGQSYLFRSHRLRFRPRQQVGDPVTVFLDLKKPDRSRMHL